MRVYDPLHLTNKMMIKEQFTQGMQAELQPTSLRERKKHLIFGLALGKPIQTFLKSILHCFSTSVKYDKRLSCTCNLFFVCFT